MTLLVPHFSGAGVANLDEEEALARPVEEDPAIAAAFALAREGSGGTPDVTAVTTILRRWYQDGVRPDAPGRGDLDGGAGRGDLRVAATPSAPGRSASATARST